MPNNSNQPGRRNDPLYWLIALGLIFTGVAAPVGVLMVVMRLLDQGKRRGRHPYYSGQYTGQRAAPPPVGARTAPAAPPRPSGKGRADVTVELDRKGKRWAIAGGALAAACFLGLTGSLGEVFYWLLQGDLAFFVEGLLNLIPLLCCIGGGLGCLWAGLRKRKKARRYRSYLAMIGTQRVVSISALASATGLTATQVRDDLADMLDDGVFSQGYLDYGGDRLVLSGEGLQETKEEPAPSQEQGEDAILAELRAVNNAIVNKKLSGQIDRVGVITAKILDYQRSHPDRAPQLHSFLSYYLPTTLKILRAYAQLEDQEVSGQNITAAMSRIEGMMDKVVEGFEKQLDLLFQGDAMDITTDVEVLERMLAKDGLSDQGGITLNL